MSRTVLCSAPKTHRSLQDGPPYVLTLADCGEPFFCFFLLAKKCFLILRSVHVSVSRGEILFTLFCFLPFSSVPSCVYACWRGKRSLAWLAHHTLFALRSRATPLPHSRPIVSLSRASYCSCMRCSHCNRNTYAILTAFACIGDTMKQNKERTDIY